MTEKVKFKTENIFSVWFYALVFNTILFTIVCSVDALISKSAFEEIGIYFAAVFVGVLISLPSLLLLIIANDFYNRKAISSKSNNFFLKISIISINLMYLIASCYFIGYSWELWVFYLITTLTGLAALFIINKRLKK